MDSETRPARVSTLDVLTHHMTAAFGVLAVHGRMPVGMSSPSVTRISVTIAKARTAARMPSSTRHTEEHGRQNASAPCFDGRAFRRRDPIDGALYPSEHRSASGGHRWTLGRPRRFDSIASFRYAALLRVPAFGNLRHNRVVAGAGRSEARDRCHGRGHVGTMCATLRCRTHVWGHGAGGRVHPQASCPLLQGDHLRKRARPSRRARRPLAFAAGSALNHGMFVTYFLP